MRIWGDIKKSYTRDGYAIVPRVFSPQECRAIRDELDRLGKTISVRPDAFIRVADLSVKQRAGVSRKDAGEAIFSIGNLPDYSARVAEFIADLRIVQLVGAALAGRAGSAKLAYHYSNLSAKPPRVGPRINWHRDFPNRYISTHRSRFCRAMVCLDGMTRANGPTAFQIGSHKISDARAKRDTNRKYMRQPYRSRLALCPPGSVILIHPKVRHGGGPNRSADPRRNIIVQWGVVRHALIATGRETCTGLPPEEVRRKGR